MMLQVRVKPSIVRHQHRLPQGIKRVTIPFPELGLPLTIRGEMTGQKRNGRVVVPKPHPHRALIPRLRHTQINALHHPGVCSLVRDKITIADFIRAGEDREGDHAVEPQLGLLASDGLFEQSVFLGPA